jgi:hypothetical protein
MRIHKRDRIKVVFVIPKHPVPQNISVCGQPNNLLPTIDISCYYLDTACVDKMNSHHCISFPKYVISFFIKILILIRDDGLQLRFRTNLFYKAIVANAIRAFDFKFHKTSISEDENIN